MENKLNFKKIGIWFGWNYEVNLRGEGIIRYVEYLFNSVLKLHPELTVEIWSSAINQSKLKDYFSSQPKFIIRSELENFLGLFFFPLKYNSYFYDYFFGQDTELWKKPYIEYRSIIGDLNLGLLNKLISKIQLFSLLIKGILFRLAKVFIHVANFPQLIIFNLIYLIFYLNIEFLSDYGFLSKFPTVSDSLLLFLGALVILAALCLLFSLLNKVVKSIYRPELLLTRLANMDNDIDFFFIPLVTMSNALGINNKKVLAAMDLFPVVFKDEYVNKYGLYKEKQIDEMLDNAVKFAKSNTFFISNSESILEQHFLGNIKELKPEKTAVIYLPANIPDKVDMKKFEYIKEKFAINKPYIFYPTQIRPNKNIIVILKALVHLHKDNLKFNLVLTGDYSSFQDIVSYINVHDLEDQIIRLKDVSENDLYLLYKYADLSIVPTLAEGGFPWQALESIFMECPVIVSDIPVVKERLKFHNISSTNLILFNPLDPIELSDKIIKILKNRKEIMQKQNILISKFKKYNWESAAEDFVQTFNKV